MKTQVPIETDQPTIAELKRQLEARTAELTDARAQQTATAEILEIINSSPGDLVPVFDAILQRAHALCGIAHGSLQLFDGEHIRAVAVHGVSEPLANILRQPRPVAEAPAVQPLLRGARYFQINDVRESNAAILRATAQLQGARTLLSVPLRREGKLLGFIVSARPEVNPFTEKEISLLESFAAQAAIAIENARLFNETREALEHQTATGEVLRVISSAMADPKPVFERIVDSVERLFECKQIGIFLAPGDGLLHLAAGRGANMEFVTAVYPQPIEQTAAPVVLGARQQVYYPNVLNGANVPQSLRRAAEVIGNFSDLLTPMMWEGRGVGMMTITREPNAAFSDKERNLLRTFADQAVIAIENARLFDEVQAKTLDLEESLQQQTATADVLKVISRSAFDLQTVLNTLVSSAARLCDADMAFIMRRQDDAYRAGAAVGFSDEYVHFLEAHPITPDRGTITGRAVIERRTVQIPDVAADPEYTLRESTRLAGQRTALGVPLLRENEPIGVIVIARKRVEEFSEKQIELVSTFADQAVIAIENVRLFDELRQRTNDLAASLDDLRAAQDRLIQTEKLASLGQLTAGIAHEIKNPLNFVNNFSALSVELTDELNDVLKQATLANKIRAEVDELTGLLKDNLQKVVQHGKRADSIVKNMLLHSREGSGDYRPADVNALVDESLNLAYHGARAEKPQFNVTLMRNFDPEAGSIEVFPQEITRVLLNLISKAQGRQWDDGF